MSFLEKGLQADPRRSMSVQFARAASVSHSVNPENLPSKTTFEDAANAEARERSMTVWQAINDYKKAIAWSLCFSSAIITEGYDTSILGSFIIAQPFIDKFGEVQPDGTKIIDATWQPLLGVAMQCGQISGLLATGYLADKFGFKKLMSGSLSWVLCTVFLLFFAQDIIMLTCGEFLMGFPLGVFQTMTITYATEVCPAILRPYLTTYVNLCWVFGQLFASGITKAFYSLFQDQCQWRIPYSFQ